MGRGSRDGRNITCISRDINYRDNVTLTDGTRNVGIANYTQNISGDLASTQLSRWISARRKAVN
jgi:hypothetical protein